jgi:hypothetical protein
LASSFSFRKYQRVKRYTIFNKKRDYSEEGDLGGFGGGGSFSNLCSGLAK